ncbi:MAG: tRNA uridine-5-carboxymethylaminomethyl(34) synthesis enzyme MnmG [Candidatus Omnitrophota bacterium]
MAERFDCIVVGAGHAGIEASLACARMGLYTLLLSMNLDTIGLMSCNPAIGGVGKGQLVKEVDALGGEMARAADATAIQFRLLNASKGQAVRSSRCQSDRQQYRLYMKSVLERQENLFLRQAEVESIIVNAEKIKGIVTSADEKFLCRALILAPGTFLDGLIHIGLKSFPGGRLSESASIGLSRDLKRLGFRLLRFKTGTCARLDSRSIDFTSLARQEPDKDPVFFSFSTASKTIEQIPCHITHTNKKTHKIIRAGLKYSPLYTGKIKATGVRYCPSIEDKIVKFADKERHQIFLEPEGRNTFEVYPNGLSTSLPLDIQIKMIHSIDGLRQAKILRPGYGIEHTVVDSTMLYPTLETKLIEGLYLAGQINGTTGYEEAAAQGIVAGINAGLKIKNEPPLILDRSNSYIGVLIDDLVTKGTNEPYRMFTSRVEYRLILREDNADLRLAQFGYKAHLVSEENFRKTEVKKALIGQELKRLKEIKLHPNKEVNDKLKKWRSSQILRPISLEDLLKRPEISYSLIKELNHSELELADNIIQQVEIAIKYQGFIQRELSNIERFRNLEKIKLPQDFIYAKVPGLSREIVEKLGKHRPISLGQASRISGVTPCAVSILMVWLKKYAKTKTE